MGRFIEVALLLVALGRVDGSSTTMTQYSDSTPADVSTLSTSVSNNPVTGEQENNEGVSYLLADIDAVRAIAGKTEGYFLVDYPQLGYNTTTTVASYSTKYTHIDPPVRVTVGVETKAFVIHVFGNDMSVYGYKDDGVFTPLPTSALGSRYVVSTCLDSTDHVVLVIVNYNQKTDVDITLILEGNVTYDSMTYNNGDTIHVSLEEYQTFTLKTSYDLTGTVINTTRAVAVLSGVMQGIYVTALTQLLPVWHHGTEYVLSTRDYSSFMDSSYNLQVVSDKTDTEIMLNNGYTFSLNSKRVYRQYLTYNETLYFNTTRPVMATLCRTNTYSISYYGFVVVTPVKYFINNAQIYNTYCINILTKQHVTDIEVFRSGMTPATVDWVDIPGSVYKAGTTCLCNNCFVRSTNRFAVYGFYNDITNGGYHFPADPSTTRAATAVLSLAFWHR